MVFCKDGKIWLPFVGAEWVGSPTYREIMIVTIDGGEKIIIPKTNIPDSGFFRTRTIDDSEILINTKYIVFAEYAILVTVHVRNLSNSAFETSGVFTYRTFVKPDTRVTVKNEFNSAHHLSKVL